MVSQNLQWLIPHKPPTNQLFICVARDHRLNYNADAFTTKIRIGDKGTFKSISGCVQTFEVWHAQLKLAFKKNRN